MSTHFEIGKDNYGISKYTDKTTEEVLSPEEAAYQEKQKGGRCFIHAVNAMAGYSLIQDVKPLINLSNQHLAHELSLDETGLKDSGLFLSDVSDIDKQGIDPAVAKKFIESNKIAFKLNPKVQIISSESRFGSKENLEIMESIQKDPKAHRVILGIGGQHYLTIRKDKLGRWRVIDSQTMSHDKSTSDKIKRIQPDFATFYDAIKHVTKAYKIDGCILIYPQEKAVKTKKIATVAAWSFAALVLGGAVYYLGSRKPAK